jgi:hypothetical protein
MRKKLPSALALAWSPTAIGQSQITAKFSQAWQSQPTLPPNPAKEKTWIFLDSLGRFEPFEGVTRTPPAFFLSRVLPLLDWRSNACVPKIVDRKGHSRERSTRFDFSEEFVQKSDSSGWPH